MLLWFSMIALSMAQRPFEESDTFAVHNNAKDTLWLLKHHELANMTWAIWANDTNWVGIRPKIIFVDEKALKSIQRRVK